MAKQQTKTSRKSGEKSPKQEVRVEGKAEYYESFSHGDVVTTIFANRGGRGEIYFRIVQQREYVWSGKQCFCGSFRPDDAVDMARGAIEANRWLRKRQRSLG
jgi:hypothetical protein